jgi:Ca-activated chloride channel family protein
MRRGPVGSAFGTGSGTGTGGMTGDVSGVLRGADVASGSGGRGGSGGGAAGGRTVLGYGQGAAAPSAAPSPEAAFERARKAAAQRTAVTLADTTVTAEGTVTRHVGDRVFFMRGDTWIDAGYKDGVRTVRVRAYSEGYFALLRALPELGPAFALGDRVLVSGRRVAVEVSPQGAERLSDAEVAAVRDAW